MTNANSSARLTRRAFILAGAATPLAACQAPYGIDYKAFGKALAVSAGLQKAPGISREQASKVPYSSIGYRLGSSAEQMLVLASENGASLLWTSAERRVLATQGGRIVKTGGFAWNLSATYFPTPDPVLAGLHKSVPADPVNRIVNFQDVEKFGVRLRSQYRRTGNTEIKILGSALQTISIVERCHCEDFDWNFENKFWVDRETGFVWRSEQNVHPNLDSFVTEILRPPA